MKKIISILLTIAVVFPLLVGFTQQKKEQPKNSAKVNATIESTDAVELYVDEIHRKIQLHWTEMGKVWKGLDYNKHDLILFKLDDNGKTQRAWVINTKEKKELTQEEFGKLQAPTALNYAKLTFNGRDSVSMSIDDMVLTSKELGPNMIYDTATHEIVHFYYQPITKENENESRSTKYPLDYKPRMYRKMIIQNLAEAFESEEKDEHLGKAKYWLEKWKMEYKDEYKTIKNTDIFEGSARYIEYLGAGLTKETTEKELKSYFVSKIAKDTSFSSVDAESYELGYVAGLLLDQIKPEWKTNYYVAGVTPVELALSDYKAIEEKMDNQLEESLKNSMDEINKQVAKEIDNIVKAAEDTNIPYLKINQNNMIGSMSLNGFYNYKGQEILSNLECAFKFDNGEIKLKNISGFSVFESKASYIMVPIPTGYKISGNKLEINTDQVKGAITVKQLKDERGRVVFVAE